ncbi:MAG: RiPP maturation radical SAM C-methyltransferase [Pseudomonadota bacterium]
MKKMRTLLMSLPWPDHHWPSAQIGTLAAYAKKHGFQIDALHSHLEAAAFMGINAYEDIAYKTGPHAGEVLCAALLFPEKKQEALKYISRHLPKAEKHIVRLNRALRKIYRSVDWPKYALVGFTIHSQQLFASLVFAQWIKRDYPDMRIIFGGQCVEGEFGSSIIELFPQVDWCVDGDGEKSFVSLLRALHKRKKKFERHIPGLIYRTDEGIKRNPCSPLLSLKGMPDPDYDHYFKTLNTHPLLNDLAITPCVPVEASRGCAYRCAFCTMSFAHNNRTRPSLEIANSIDRLCKRFCVDRFDIVATMLDLAYCNELASHLISHKRSYKIMSAIRANTPKELLILMKRAGILYHTIGLEAFDSSLLKKMNKGTRCIDNINILKRCEVLGIMPFGNLLINFPTESQKEIDRSVWAMDYASSFAPPAHVSTFHLSSGSLIYHHPKKYGVCRVDRASKLASILPKDIGKRIKLWDIGFKTKRRPNDYRKFNKRLESWRKKYEKAEANNHPLLYYSDCKDFLKIEDSRHSLRIITLEGWMREVYLFCDDIKSFDKIKKRFPDVSERTLRRTLNKLFKLKVMFNEGNDWLSLAIHASPENRRHMPFL